MALNDWFEMKHHMNLGAAGAAMHVWHFQRFDGLTTAPFVNQAFLDTVIPTMRALQVTTLTHVSLETQNLGDESDFQTLALGGLAGTASAGDGEPTFVTARLQFLRERTDMNHGWKKIAGVPEANVNFNSLLGTYVTTLQALGDLIVSGLELATDPGVVVARYGVIARICAETDAAGACISYRMPESDLELDFYIPSQVIGRATVGSQNTRKA